MSGSDTRAMGLGGFSPAFLEDYEVIRTLGYGGMAEVFLARHKRLNREVAIKVLSPLAFTAETSRPRFEQEGRLTANLSHPNIVTLLSFGEDANRPYLVFEFVKGQSLRDLIKLHNRLPPPRALELTMEMARGLQHAHDANVIHRDLKPENVLITESGVAKIADFGLAKVGKYGAGLTREGIVLGTPGYMAPEVIEGKDATFHSDIYGLAVILFEMLTGEILFPAKKDRELLIAHVAQRAPRLSEVGFEAPDCLERFVLKNLSRRSEQRTASAAEFADELLAMSVEVAQFIPPPIRREEAGFRPDSTARVPSDMARRAVEEADAEILAGGGTRAVRSGIVAGKRGRPTSRKLDIGPPATTQVQGVDPRSSQLPPWLVPAFAIASLTVVAVGLGLWLMKGIKPDVVVLPKIVDEMHTVRGSNSVLLSWRTTESMVTRIWLWNDEEGESHARTFEPRRLPDAPPPEHVRDHTFQLGGLEGGRTFNFRLIFPDGTLSKETYKITPLSSAATLIRSFLVKYTGINQVQCTIGSQETLTCGVRLREPDGDVREFLSQAGRAGLHRITISDIDPDQYYDVEIYFDEIDDVIPQQRILGIQFLAKRLESKLTETSSELKRLNNELGRLFAPEDSASDREESPAENLSKLRVKAEGRLRDFCRNSLDVDFDQISSGLAYYFSSESAGIRQKFSTYIALQSLEDTDQLVAHFTGGPLIPLGDALESFIRVQISDYLPTDKNDLLESERFPEGAMRRLMQAGPLVLITNSEAIDNAVKGLFQREASTSPADIRRAQEYLSTMGTPDGWVKVPMPSTLFPSDSRALIGIRLRGLESLDRLHLRFSTGEVITLRPPDSEAMRRLRKEGSDTSVAAIVEMPLELIQQAKERLELKVDQVSLNRQVEDSLHCVWISRIIIAPPGPPGSR